MPRYRVTVDFYVEVQAEIPVDEIRLGFRHDVVMLRLPQECAYALPEIIPVKSVRVRPVGPAERLPDSLS